MLISFGLQLEPRQFLGLVRWPAFDAEVVGDDIRPSAYFTSRFKFSAGLQDSQGKAFVSLYKPKVVAIIGDHNRSGFSCAKCD
jgi:hypothetical protein